MTVPIQQNLLKKPTKNQLKNPKGQQKKPLKQNLSWICLPRKKHAPLSQCITQRVYHAPTRPLTGETPRRAHWERSELPLWTLELLEVNLAWKKREKTWDFSLEGYVFGLCFYGFSWIFSCGLCFYGFSWIFLVDYLVFQTYWVPFWEWELPPH